MVKKYGTLLDTLQGVVAIPKSDREERIVENRGIFGWELSNDDCKTIERLDEGQKGILGSGTLSRMSQ